MTMKAGTWKTTAITRSRTYFPNGTVTESTLPWTAWKKDITGGGENPGNHLDPTNWQYKVFVHSVGYCFVERYTYSTKIKTTTDGFREWGTYIPVADRYLWTDVRSFVYNKALSRLNDKVRGGLDWTVNVGEWSQTQKMYRQLGRAVNNILRARSYIAKQLAKRARQKALHPLTWKEDVNPATIIIGGLGVTANGFLVWKYGWRPLLQSLWDSAEEVRRKVETDVSSFSGSWKEPVQKTGAGSLNINSVSGPWELEGNGAASCTIKVRLAPPAVDLARWGTLNPVSLAWELIPYSFVVDWFWNVSNYLRNIETSYLYRTGFVNGYISELLHYKAYRTYGANSYHLNGVDNYRTKMRCFVRQVEFQRRVLTTYPLPYFPSVRVDMGASRWASAWALITQKVLPR